MTTLTPLDIVLILAALMTAALCMAVLAILLLGPKEEDTAYRYFEKGNEDAAYTDDRTEESRIDGRPAAKV